MNPPLTSMVTDQLVFSRNGLLLSQQDMLLYLPLATAPRPVPSPLSSTLVTCASRQRHNPRYLSIGASSDALTTAVTRWPLA